MTAVEYLFEEILKLESEYYIGNIGRIDLRKKRLELFEQAKEMEKQQIKDAHGSKLKKSRGVTNYEYWYTGENYYNDTFKNTNDEKNT